MAKNTDTQAKLRRGAAVYPQPVAMAVGRLARARNDAECADGCLKAAEVLARYLAGICVSSFAARESACSDGRALAPLAGDLSFGRFLQVVQQVSAMDVEHPCRSLLAPFRSKGKGAQRTSGIADVVLVSLLNLRNEIGHDLVGLGAARATAIVQEHRPVERFVEALDALEGLLSCPLFVIDQQRLERRRVWAVRMWLMGDSPDPDPEEVEVENLGVEETRVPYVAIDERLLRLDPVLAWAVVPARQRYSILVVDGVTEKGLRYQTLDPVEVERNGASASSLAELVAGQLRPAERVLLTQGRKLSSAWRERKGRLEDALQRIDGTLPWEDFDATTLQWYASRLPSNGSGNMQAHITELLFDGRRSFSVEEIRQIQILFGTEGVVRRLIGRGVLDLRVPGEGDQRWAERVETSSNILASLRVAVDFLIRHLHIEGSSVDKLSETTGSADYLAMREALVNLFIHQDYGDARAAAQVEIGRQRATFFNMGHSLLAAEQLVEGGKSQARNPLIARALRLIGFAELAGSGISALQRAWRQSNRRPPRFETSRENNAFTVQLDWRELVNAYDEFWKSRIGARLTPDQATILNMALDPAGITPVAVVSGTGLTLNDAQAAIRVLVGQVLLTEREGTYFIADHLREIAT
ncbi:ATP-binding protein [Polyangium mundeleinium]|uniref:ATP-binding protein n=1 Tax=Polyangium mundeleinium TaxID=2995306 RepID=A0ABT5EJC6_9BACT|nr:ATP-binding protein [Polyangium mundeleinium]MDC0740860.1 ATP-binding protein [Polyangium mundeleinium]